MLEEKLDALVAAMNKNTEALHAVLAAGGAATATVAAAADKPKAGRKPKDEPAAPKTDQATLKAKFEELKATSSNVPELKKIIAAVGFTSLAELLTNPAKYDEAYAKLTEFEASLTPAEDEDDL